jgi:hypothetical protein
MYSSLTAMIASAHRDELRRQATRHSVTRLSRREAAARNTPGTARARLLSLRLGGRRSEVRPAVAA